MPIYCWRCPTCGRGREVVRAVADYQLPETCGCGAAMQRELTPAYVNPDIQPYRATAGDMAGKFITSRVEHKKFLKRNKLVELGNDPIRPTDKMRKTVSRKEIREELRKVVPDALRNDKRRKRA